MRLLPAFVFIGSLLMSPIQAHAAWFNDESNLVDTTGAHRPDLPTPSASQPLPQETEGAVEHDRAPSIPSSPQFVSIMDDLPLMPGLTMKSDHDVVFLSRSSGRLAVAEAVGLVDVDDVYNFYRETLPSLGWTKLDARSFGRDHDVLRLDVHGEGKTTTVRYSVHPK